MNAFADETSRDFASPFIVWGRALLDDPEAALSDILSGRGGRGAQQRAEPEDFLADLLAHPNWQDQRAQLTEGLDAALLNWLEAWIEWPPARISRFGTRAYAARISDALKVAARLPLKGTAQELTWNQATWDNRFRGLRWPGDIDLLRRFDLVLAQHQADNRFISRWFAACDEAAWGSPYWRSSLGTGLLGLRKLPPTADIEPERRVAAALARFGALALERGMSTFEAKSAFWRRAAALTVLYPRHDGHWQDVWDRALGDLPSRCGGDVSTIRTHWLDQVLARGGANGRQPLGRRKKATGRVAGRPDALPDGDRRRRIQSAINQAEFLSEALWEQTRELIRAYWAFASGSGESYFAVRTTHNLCDRLLRLGPSEPHLAEIHVWTLQAIEAESENAYIWDLWAKVLSELGRHDASLSVRWESMRRFPDNCVLRNSLAEALLEHHRVPLAESLLRETMRDFPRDAFSRHILVKMLWRQGRQEQAEAEFVTLGELAPDNPYVQSFVETMTTTPAAGSQGAWLGISEDRGTESDADTRRRSGPGREGARVLGQVIVEAGSEISTYLDRLANQVPLLQDYFAPLEGASGTCTTLGAPNLDEIISEFTLVAAHRAGLMEGPEAREHLKAWTSGRPSSYSARLLLAWQGREGNGLDHAAISGIAREFPENRRWNDWLCYGFIPKEERSRLQQEALQQEATDGRDETDRAFWSGRLSAVYPGLKTKEEKNEDGVSCDSAALKRLLEDVAFAGADRALPSVSIS